MSIHVSLQCHVDGTVRCYLPPSVSHCMDPSAQMSCIRNTGLGSCYPKFVAFLFNTGNCVADHGVCGIQHGVLHRMMFCSADSFVYVTERTMYTVQTRQDLAMLFHVCRVLTRAAAVGGDGGFEKLPQWAKCPVKPGTTELNVEHCCRSTKLNVELCC